MDLGKSEGSLVYTESSRSARVTPRATDKTRSTLAQDWGLVLSIYRAAHNWSYTSSYREFYASSGLRGHQAHICGSHAVLCTCKQNTHTYKIILKRRESPLLLLTQCVLVISEPSAVKLASHSPLSSAGQLQDSGRIPFQPQIHPPVLGLVFVCRFLFSVA